MRFVVTALVCAGVLAAVAGCDPVTERRMMNEGAGVDLYTADTASQAELQNQYVTFVCQQAGEPCTWTAFVQAGMNDIDQRCDAYLTWLDAKRRDRDLVTNQLTAIGMATSSIMTVSGAGTGSLDIVTAALGLASATYTNWNSRLLLAANQSTVQTVVYSRQTQYRNAVKNEIVVDRPRAIYLLRNYLRLCMPTTIEADINTSTTLVQRGDPAAAVLNPVVNPVAAPLTSRQAIAAPIRIVTPSVPAFAALFVNYTPAQFPLSQVKRIQASLCVPVSEQGKVGIFTTNLITIYEQATRQQLTGKLSNRDVGQILSPPPPSIPCSADGAKNYYERTTYTDATQVGALVKRLNRSTVGGPLDEKATLAQARTKIRAVRGALAGNLTLQLPDAMADQMTSDLDTALFNAH